MKDEMPLTDRDFAGIRKAVMAKVEAQELRRRWLVRGLQVAFAALVVVVGAVWWVKSTPQRQVIPAQTAQQPSNPVTLQTQQPLTRPPATLSPHGGARETRVASHHHRHSAPKHEPVLAAASDGNPIRLELATADPDIRIIWISNPTESR